jgi:prephenate dehydrogenase
MRVAILGFGLIGGSIARALRAAPDANGGADAHDWTVVAWSPSGSGPRDALAAGDVAVAASGPAEALDGADLVVLAAPPLACLELLDRLAGDLHGAMAPGAVITDVASTKTLIVERAAALGLRFVGAHPMAGRETSGYATADPALFRDRPWVVVPAGDDIAEERVVALAVRCRARPVRLPADVHDRAVAAVSHLPLVVSAALAEAVTGAPDWATAQLLAASGWAGMTRLARGDPEMGAGIVATNADALAERLHALRGVVDLWLAMLERSGGPEPERVRERLAAALTSLGPADR